MYEKPGKMHCVFQISQKNSACTASLGYWKMQDLPSCIRWQTHLVLYVFDRTARSLAAPSGKTVHTLIRIGGSWTRAHQRYLSSMLQLPCLEATYLSDQCSNQFCTEIKTVTSHDVPPDTGSQLFLHSKGQHQAAAAHRTSTVKLYTTHTERKEQASTMPHLTQTVRREVMKFSSEIILKLCILKNDKQVEGSWSHSQ